MAAKQVWAVPTELQVAYIHDVQIVVGSRLRRGSQVRPGQTCNGGSAAALTHMRRRGFRAGAESATGVAAAPGKQWQRGSSCSPAAAAPWTLLRRGSSCGWGSAAAVFVWCLVFVLWAVKNGVFCPVRAGCGERRRPPRVFPDLPAGPSAPFHPWAR